MSSITEMRQYLLCDKLLHPVHVISRFMHQLLRRSTCRYVASRSTHISRTHIFLKMALPLVVDHHDIQVRLHVTFLNPTRYIPLGKTTVHVLRTHIQEHNSFHITASNCAESSLPVIMVCHLLNIKQTY